MRTPDRYELIWFQFSLGFALSALLCCSGEDGTSVHDADSGGGLTLTDVDPLEEAWRVEPTSIEFGHLEIGDFDFRTLTFTNQSGVTQSIKQISLVDAHTDVRFASTFISSMGRPHRWLDLNGDGHDFEVRENALEVHAGGYFEVIIQYHPTGGMDECFDPPPAACGFLVLSGDEHSISAPIFIPR